MTMYDLNISWEAYFQEGRKPKFVHASVWKPPADGVKLNFDGSIVKEVPTISSHLWYMFNHVLRGANDEADCFA